MHEKESRMLFQQLKNVLKTASLGINILLTSVIRFIQRKLSLVAKKLYKKNSLQKQQLYLINCSYPLALRELLHLLPWEISCFLDMNLTRGALFSDKALTETHFGPPRNTYWPRDRSAFSSYSVFYHDLRFLILFKGFPVPFFSRNCIQTTIMVLRNGVADDLKPGHWYTPLFWWLVFVHLQQYKCEIQWCLASKWNVCQILKLRDATRCWINYYNIL